MPTIGIDIIGSSQQLSSARYIEVQHRISSRNLVNYRSTGTAVTTANLILPASTIAIGSIAGAYGIAVGGGIVVISGQLVSYTSRSGGNLLGCVGGFGAIAAGASVIQANWVATYAYAAGDYVIYAGQEYVAIATSTGVTPGSDTTNWLPIGADASPWASDGLQPVAATVYVQSAQQGTVYDVRIRYVNVDGSVTPWAEFDSHEVVGKNVGPSDVVGFAAVATGFGMVSLSWTANPEPDIDHYEIRVGSVWSTATFVGLTKSLSYLAQSNVGIYTYLIKAVDTAGNESTDAESATVSVTSNLAFAVTQIAGTANQLQASGAVGSVTLSLAGPWNLSSVAAHGLLVGNGTSAMNVLGPPAANTYILGANGPSADPTWKQLVAGSGISLTFTSSSVTITNSGGGGSGGPVSSITGTAHQIVASASTGAVTLSTPQDIDTVSSVTFARLIATGGAHAFGVSSQTPLMSGYTTLVDIAAASTNVGALQLYNSATSANSVVGDLIFGTLGTADADQRTALVRGVLDLASGTHAYGRLQFYTNAAGVWTLGMSISSSGVVTLGSLIMPNAATAGDLFYGSTGNTMGRLGVGSTGQLLTVSGGLPAWTGGTNGQILIGNGTGFTKATITAGSGISITNGAGSITISNTGGGGGGSGGVTSLTGTTDQVITSASTGVVVLSLPQNIDTGAMVTFGTATLNAIANNQTLITGKRYTDTSPTGYFANFLSHAGASLFAIDVTGTVTAGAWNGTAVAANYGGTGQTVYAVGDVLYANSTTTLARLAAGTNNYVLTANGAGAAPTWQASSSGFINPMTTVGDLIIGGAAGAPARQAAVAAGALYSSNGVAANPIWDTTPYISGSLLLGSAAGAAAAANQIKIDSNVNSTVNLLATNAGGSVGAWLLLRGARGLIGSEGATQLNDYLGLIDFRGYGATVYDAAGGRISVNASELHSDTANGSLMRFYTTANTTAALALALTLGQDQSATFGGNIALGGNVITGGAWNGTAIAANYGGTGQTVYAVGDLLYASTTTALSRCAAVAAGQVLTSNGVGVAPVWDASPYLSTGLLIGSNAGVAVAANQLKIDSSASALHLLATAASASGVGGWITLRGARGAIGAETATQVNDYLGLIDFHGYGATAYDAAGGRISVYASEIHSNTANGSYMRFSTTPNTTATLTLALTLGQDQSAAFTGALSAPTATIGSLALATAGTTGDLFAASATNTMGRITAVAAGQVLTSNGVGVAPVWDASPYLSTGLLIGSNAGVAVAANQLKIDSSASAQHLLATGASASGVGGWISLRGARGAIGAETATQVNDYLGLIDFHGYGTTVYDVAGGRISVYASEIHSDTANGSLMRFYTTANTTAVLALALTLGQDQSATFGGNVSLGANSVTAGIWAGTAIAANYGGTGQSVYAVGDLLYASTTTALSRRAAVATGSVLISQGTGTAPIWSASPSVTSLTLSSQFIGTITTITYSASMTPSSANGLIQTISATNTTAFTINNPSTAFTSGAIWVLRVANASGGSMGAISWGTTYKVGTWTNPANGKSRVAVFYYDGTSNWLVSQSGSDL